MNRGYSRIAVAVCVTIMCLAWLWSCRKVVKQPAVPQAEAEERSETPALTTPTEPAVPSPRTAERTGLRRRAASGTKGDSPQWEDEKIRSMALDLARKVENTAKIKICLDEKADEWWIILYEEAGSQYRLHQYIWNRTQDKIEEFLVEKTIARSQLEANLGSAKPEMACEVIEYSERKKPPSDKSVK